jgi:hypothetical protein
VLLLFPTIIPLILQTNIGAVPPFTGVAVKVSVLPMHTGFEEAEIVQLTGEGINTIIEMIFDVVGIGIPQDKLEVRTHFTLSPFIGI